MVILAADQFLRSWNRITLDTVRGPASDMGASVTSQLQSSDGKVPSDWEQSFIVLLYKEKGATLERGNYLDLKLTGHESPGEDCGQPHQTAGVS